MSIQIQKGKKSKPSRIALYAVEGIGKTTLAATFPNPLFLDTEGGSDYVEADSFPTASIEDLDAAVKYLTTESHEYETVVVDTLDYFEQVLGDNLCKARGWSDLSAPGYGEGPIALEAEMLKLLLKFDTVIAAGIHVVFIVHAIVKPFTDPTIGSSYDRFQMQLAKRSEPLVKGNVDHLLFVNYDTMVLEQKKDFGGTTKKGARGKERVCHTQRTAAFDAKCRADVPESFTLPDKGVFPPELAPLFAYKRGQAQGVKPQAKQPKAAQEPAQTQSEPIAPVNPDTMDELAPIIEAAGGQDAVDTWLESKGKTLDRALEDQIVGRPDAFIQAVKKFTDDLNG
jgi:hypothetical protein